MPTQKEKFRAVADAIVTPPIPKTPSLPEALKKRFPDLAEALAIYDAEWEEFHKQLRNIS